MDPWAVLFWLALAAAIGAAVVAARDRRRLRRAQARAAERATSLEVARIERRQAREALADLLDDGILDVDAGLRIRRANPAAERMLGRAPGALVGRSVIEAFLDADAERIAARAISDGTAAGEAHLQDPDGRTIAIQGTRTSAGGATIQLRDVSELHRLRRIRTEFIDNLSHELRTPLTTVSLLAETLSREADASEGALPGKMRDRIAKIEVETGHLVQMVNELLDLSRIESGTSLGQPESVDPVRLAEHAADRLRLFAERQGIALHVEGGDAVPAVRGDPERLGQVLVNLIHNAIKFSPDGGDVVVAVSGTSETVSVTVTDHGVGIPRGAQERIFERFYKVDRARVRGEAGGTGLGLSIARHVVEQHGGRIRVESSEGRGSTFTIELPVAV